MLMRAVLMTSSHSEGPNPISIANGSAYGVGVYTAKEPSTSDHYARGSGQMLVCAGLCKQASHNAGSIVVFSNEQHVLPCYLVKYR